MRRLLVFMGALGLVAGLVGCSSDGDGDEEVSAETTAGATTTETVDPDEGLFLEEDEDPGFTDIEGDWDEFPCDIIDQAGVDEIFGASDDRVPPLADAVNVIEDGEEWTAAACTWSVLGDAAIDPDVEPDATIQISQADDFPDGEVLCPEIAGVEPFDGVGDSAQWDWSDPGTTLTVGNLRVCTADALIDVRAGGVGGEAELQGIAVALANAAIAAL